MNIASSRPLNMASSRPMKATASRSLLTIALLLAAACRRAGDPAADAVRELARAANRRDASAIFARLAPGFAGPSGETAADVDAELRRLFAAYSSVDVAVENLTLDRLPEFTLARFAASFRGSARRLGGMEALLPESARYRFELRLVDVGGKYGVARAFWEEIGR